MARMMRSLWRWLFHRRAVPQAARPLPRAKHQGLSIKDRLGRYEGGHVTLGGEVVQSKPELRIANFLFKRKVRYVYEAMLEGATPDFYLPDSHIILEHWGMTHSRYRETRAKKTRIYLSRGYTLVETEKKDVPHLERVLESRLLKADPEIFSRAP